MTRLSFHSKCLGTLTAKALSPLCINLVQGTTKKNTSKDLWEREIQFFFLNCPLNVETKPTPLLHTYLHPCFSYHCRNIFECCVGDGQEVSTVALLPVFGLCCHECHELFPYCHFTYFLVSEAPSI